MNRLKVMCMTVALLLGATAYAQSSSKTVSLKKSSITSTIGNMLEGIFTKTNLEIADLVGEYESAGPAVSFKSDNFLQKAGGIAGAAALETKLQPYYEQYGLIGMPFTVDKDGNFVLTVKGLKVKGILEKNDNDGTFIFNIMLGTIRVGKFLAYVEKSGRNINLMFDATKLKELISTIGSVTGIQMAKTMATLLDSYDGACIGFKMNNTGSGNAAAGGSVGTDTDSTNSTQGLDGIGTLLDRLKRR